MVILKSEKRASWILLTPFILLSLAAGVIPIGFALWTALQKPETIIRPQGGFGGLSALLNSLRDPRLITSFKDILIVMSIWLPIMMLGIVGLALLVHSSKGKFAGIMRGIYYLPGALGGIANFMLWVYLVDPQFSPINFIWKDLKLTSISSVVSIGNTPYILAAMLFFQGVGSWMIIVNGGLNGIPDEILEASSIDGAGTWRNIFSIKLPLVLPWIGYAFLLNVAYGFQLFLEPYLLNEITQRAVPSQYAPSQLAYEFAFTDRNLPAASALSLVLLVISLGIGMIVVLRTGLLGDRKVK